MLIVIISAEKVNLRLGKIHYSQLRVKAQRLIVKEVLILMLKTLDLILQQLLLYKNKE